jgi:hypothetical protein
MTLRTASSVLEAMSSEFRAGAEALVADGVGVGGEDAAEVVGDARRPHVVEVGLDDGVG